MRISDHVLKVLLPGFAVLALATSAAWTARRLAGEGGIAGLVAATASALAVWSVVAAVCVRGRTSRATA